MKRTSILAILTVVLVLMLALAAPAATVNCSGVAAWSPNSVAYATGALVTYNGSEYKCLQAHTSQAGWDPADVPALWSLQGTCTTGATPTPTATATATATAKPTATATATPTAKPTATATATATAKPTATATATPKPTATATPSGPACWPAWNPNTPYSGGGQVSKGGENYQAAYWTQGNDPTIPGNSGPAGSGAYWIPEGACGGSGGPTPTPTATANPTATPTATATAKPTATATATATAKPTATPTPVTGNGNGRIMAGYWHDWETPEFIPLASVPSSYDIIVVAFANYSGGGTFTFTVDPDESQAQFIADIKTLHGQGKKVLLSCGGASETPSFASSSDASNFASSMSGLLNQYGFDGVDIDFENGGIFLNANDLDINNPTTPSVVYTIQALENFHGLQPNAMITIAPIPNYLQAAYQYYGPGQFGASNWNGAQLPVINNARNIITYVWPQYYNEANIEGLDNNLYSEGSEDNLVAMSEMLAKGFPVANNAGTFNPLNQQQVVIGVPACSEASPGNMSNAQLEGAFNYLNFGGSPVGSYTLRNSSGYPDVSGFMTWSINWDVFCQNGGLASGIKSYLNGLPKN